MNLVLGLMSSSDDYDLLTMSSLTILLSATSSFEILEADL